jgi:hypothetical protein
MSNKPQKEDEGAKPGAEGAKPSAEAAAPPQEPEGLPPTALAGLRALARERLGPTPDKAGPAATRTMAAIVRDLKGMPEILVAREHTHKIKLQRRGKVGAITLEYQVNIRAMEVGHVGFPGADPTTVKLFRYTFAEASGASGEWHRLDEGGELIDDVRTALLRLYPELGSGD